MEVSRFDDVGWRRRCASYGVIATDRKICSTYSGGACSRSRSAAATERSAEIGRFNHDSLPLRARDPLEPPGRRCARSASERAGVGARLASSIVAPNRKSLKWNRRRRRPHHRRPAILFSGLLLADSGSGRRWSSGGSMMSAGAGAARATGSSATDRKICSTDSGGACSRSRSAAATAALNDHQKLAALT